MSSDSRRWSIPGLLGKNDIAQAERSAVQIALTA